MLTFERQLHIAMPEEQYGLRAEFTMRDWHRKCLNAYTVDVLDWKNSNPGEQHRYTIYGGTASGKTQCGANLSSYLLNTKEITHLVVVVPNVTIMDRTIAEYKGKFNIELLPYGRDFRHGVPSKLQGYVITYQALMNHPYRHRAINDKDALVIFDEVHHLGQNKWGDAAHVAFELVKYVISLTGTPYRGAGDEKISFVNYEDVTECDPDDEDYGDRIVKFVANFRYSFGAGVADGVCREPVFVYSEAEIRVRDPNRRDGYRVVTFDDVDLNREMSSDRLKGSVEITSYARRRMLGNALSRCKQEGRKVIVFLGGDTGSAETPTRDALEHLPGQLLELGYSEADYEIAVNATPDAASKIATFGASDKWILITVNMVSEGVDIPELSAAIFLTTITAKQTTIQRIGRAARRREDDPFNDALIFMMRDPNLVAINNEIKGEIDLEISLRKKESREQGKPNDNPRNRREVMCFAGGETKYMGINGELVDAHAVENLAKELVSEGFSLHKAREFAVFHVYRTTKENHNGDR